MSEPPIPDLEGLEVPLLENQQEASNRVETEAPEATEPEIIESPFKNAESTFLAEIRYPSLDAPMDLPVINLPNTKI